MMDFRSGHTSRGRDIADLFIATFSASEGPDEGARIGELVDSMMETTPDPDLIVWSAYEDEDLIGCIFLSRLVFAQDNRAAFILSPVAVKITHQKTGVGQKLITHGLNDMRQNQVDFVATYGDPNYYSKVGFRQITEEFAQAPLTLSHPHGWLGQMLSGADHRPMNGASSCVQALNNPEYW